MHKPCKKLLLIGAILAITALMTVASQVVGYWTTVLAEDFNQLRTMSGVFKGIVGTFAVEDGGDIISQEFQGQNGVLLFSDPSGGLPEASTLWGLPTHAFDCEDELYLQFVVDAGQPTSCWQAALSDEDDLDVLLVSLNPNGQWFVNGLDTEVTYETGIAYVVQATIARDASGTCALYTVACYEQDDESTYMLLSSGILPEFDSTHKVTKARFEKPAMSPAGWFALDDVLLQYLKYPNGDVPNVTLHRQPRTL